MKIYLISNESTSNIYNITTSALESNGSRMIPNTYKLPKWRWILSYNIKDFHLFTIKRISTIYYETIKT